MDSDDRLHFCPDFEVASHVRRLCASITVAEPTERVVSSVSAFQPTPSVSAALAGAAFLRDLKKILTDTGKVAETVPSKTRRAGALVGTA